MMRKTLLTLALLAAPSLASAQQWPPPPPPPQDGGQLVVQQADGSVTPVQAAPQLQYNMVYGPEPDSSGARLTLTVGQAINGMGLGLSLAMLTGSESPGVYGGALLLGGGVGAVAALVASRHGITEGQADAVNFGSGFGGLASMFLLFGINENFSSQAVGGILAAGLTLGTAGGIVAATQNPLSGRVNFAASLGLWGAFLGSHVWIGTRGYGADRASDALRSLGWSSFAVMGAGLAAGALLAPSVHVSARRMRYINLAATGGWAVIGLSSALFASGSGGDAVLTAYGFGSIAGVAAGAVVGTLLTDDTDAFWEQQRRTTARNFDVNLAPGGPGGSLGLSLGGSF